MNKRGFYYILILLLIFPVLYSKPVSKKTIEEKLGMFASRKGITFDEILNLEEYKYSDLTVFYAVNLYPEGWILLAADDVVEPVLGYSKTGTFIKNDLPESIGSWFSGYGKEIYSVVNSGVKTANSQWESLSTKAAAATTEDTVDPILKVNFNQSSPWNYYCPSSTDGKAYVGCVAVAMAQAMTTIKYPDRPVGAFGYNCNPYGYLYINYDEEPAFDWSLIISGSDNKRAAARLLYQCGVALKMEYSATGSGTLTSYIPEAMKTFYKYPSSVKLYSRGSNTTEWENLIKNELLHSRVVIYAGNDGLGNPGHCFNLDGYDGNNMYHINWGWGGANNGYYTINNVKDGTSDYTKNQQLVVGVRAPSVAPSDIYLSNLTVEANKPSGTIVGSVTIDSEAENPVYKYELKGGYSVFTHDYLPSSFYVENGSLKTLVPFSLEDESIPVIINVTNVNNELSYEKQFNIKIVTSPSSIQDRETAVTLSYSNKTIYLSNDGGDLQFDLYSLAGNKVLSSVLTTGKNDIDEFNLARGCYLLKTIDEKVQPLKIFIY